MSTTLAAPPVDAAKPASPAAVDRPLLSSMEVREPARRRADGSVSVIVPVPGRVFLYGPFLRLPGGHYRLTFRCRFQMSVQGAHPVLGLEVVAQNRVLCAWRDFTPAELAGGEQSVSFHVPPDLSIEGGADAPFEFRFAHFGNALLQVTDVTLETLARPEPAMGRAEAPATGTEATETWRLLGRLRTLPWPGGVSFSPFTVSRLKFGRASAILRLPAGRYRLELACHLKAARRPAGPALEILVRTRDRITLGTGMFHADDLARGRASFEFEVPADVALDAGAPRNIDFRFRHFRNAAFKITALDLHRLPAAEVAGAPSLARRPAGAGRRLGTKKVVIFGNCQANLVAEAFRDNPGFSRRFSVKNHPMELPANLHEQGKRDLEECELLLIQDIKEWEQYPLRDYVPDTLPTLRYPCIRFASPWPFDAFNGPDDKLARNRDLPNFEFTYFDGLLARLRRDIPDLEERFAAYRDLNVKGVIDVNRLHVFEERRLLAMDEKFAGGIGAYILENFRSRQLFYTTAHPNGKILGMLMKQIAKELGVRQAFWFPGPLDSLKRLQIPVHPKVARALNVRWADENTKYLVHGQHVTWEAYFRKYISYYG